MPKIVGYKNSKGIRIGQRSKAHMKLKTVVKLYLIDSSLKYWSHRRHPTLYYFMASDLITSLDLMDLTELLSSYIWLRDLFIWSWFVVLLLSKKINPSAVFHLTFFMKAWKMKPVALFFFLIFLWLFHIQISNEGFSAQPTEASLHWGYKTSLILSSKT